MSNGRSTVIGPLAGHGTVAFTFNTSGDGQRALGQPAEAPLFPVPDPTLTQRAMSEKSAVELTSVVKIVLQDTLKLDSSLNRRMSNLKFPFTGVPGGKGVSDPGRLSQVLQPRATAQPSAKQLAAIENSPKPTGVVLSPALAGMIAAQKLQPEAPLPQPAAPDVSPAPVATSDPPAVTETSEDPFLKFVTKPPAPPASTTMAEPVAIDVAPEPIVNSAAILAAYPPAYLPCVLPEPESAPVAEDPSESSQAEEASASEPSPDPSSEGSASDDEDESEASHEQDAASAASSSSEFVPGKKEKSSDDDDDDEDDDDDDDDDEDDEDDDGSDSIAADKESDEYNEADDDAADEGEEDCKEDGKDDDEDDEDDDDGDEADDEDSDDAPLCKLGNKRKSNAASPPKKRTPPAAAEAKPAVEVVAEPVPTPAPAPAIVITITPKATAVPKAPAGTYPIIARLLDMGKRDKYNGFDAAELQTITAFYNLLSLKNGSGVYANPLRDALQSGFDFSTANDKQRKALQMHAVEIAGIHSEIHEVRQAMMAQLQSHSGLGDKMRDVLRLVCSEQYVMLEQMPLPKILPGQRCDLTNELIRAPLGRQNDSPRWCRIVTLGPARIVEFATNDLMFAELNHFITFFQITRTLVAQKPANQSAEWVAGVAEQYFRSRRHICARVKEWANNGKFLPGFLAKSVGIEPISFDWQPDQE